MITLGKLNPGKPTPESAERSLAMVHAFRKADEEYRKVCAKKGIPYVPIVAGK